MDCHCQVPHAGVCPVRFSRLKLMAQSPLHYKHATVEETMAMERGSAVHSLVLGGQPVIAWEEGRPRRGKEFDRFEADNPGALILTATEFEKANAIAAAVKKHRLAMSRLDGEREVETSWSFGKRRCAARIDAIPIDGVTELKISMTANPARFHWHALRQGWLAQTVWYLDGMAKQGRVLEAARIVAVEPKPPFALTVFRLDEPTMEMARKTYRLWFERLLACEDANEWPAYAQDEVTLSVPDNDVELDFGEAEAA